MLIKYLTSIKINISVQHKYHVLMLMFYKTKNAPRLCGADVWNFKLKINSSSISRSICCLRSTASQSSEVSRQASLHQHLSIHHSLCAAWQSSHMSFWHLWCSSKSALPSSRKSHSWRSQLSIQLSIRRLESHLCWHSKGPCCCQTKDSSSCHHSRSRTCTRLYCNSMPLHCAKDCLATSLHLCCSSLCLELSQLDLSMMKL